jgi:hypothetical protein
MFEKIRNDPMRETLTLNFIQESGELMVVRRYDESSRLTLHEMVAA